MARMFSHAFQIVAYDSNWGDGMPYYGTSRKEDTRGADLAVVCVPTPMADDGSCDTRIVEEVCGWIDAPLVVIKSTVPPGFTQRMNETLCVPPIKFHFSPEYAGEPVNYVPPQYPDPRDSVRHDFCIVGGPRASEVLDFFARVMATSARYVATDSTTAELCKYMENTYFATKIMFCTEFSRLAKEAGVDYKELRNLWLLDSRVDPDHTMVFPDALGFGGKCLPKDLSAIVQWGERTGTHVPFLKMVRDYNNFIRTSNAAR